MERVSVVVCMLGGILFGCWGIALFLDWLFSLLDEGGWGGLLAAVVLFSASIVCFLVSRQLWRSGRDKQTGGSMTKTAVGGVIGFFFGGGISLIAAAALCLQADDPVVSGLAFVLSVPAALVGCLIGLAIGSAIGRRLH
jgi:hypothetical protein